MAQDPEPTFINTELYKLPNDATEHDRLERQGAAMHAFMGNRHTHAPLTSPRAVLDIGCGTGFVTRALAAQHPSATAVGVDLSPVPPATALPRNVRFVQGDVRALSAAGNLAAESFDLVFSRLLVCGMTDWPGYVALAAKLAAPGGFVELQDLPYVFYRRGKDGGHEQADAHMEWLEVCRRAGRQQGMDWECALKFERWMREAGLVDIEVHEYVWPFGRWLKDERPETEMVGVQLVTDIPRVWYHLVRRMLEGRESEDRIKELQEQVLNTNVETPGLYGRWFAVVGKKPA